VPSASSSLLAISPRVALVSSTMGLFTKSQRKSVQKDTTNKEGATPRSRLSFGSILSRRESSCASARRSTASGSNRKGKPLMVQVEPPQQKVDDNLCRFIATSTKLGSGAYGAVLLGQDLCTQAPVAIKFIPEGRMRESSLAREVSMLQRLSDANHPALVKFHGHVLPADVRAGEVRADGTLPLSKPHTSCHALVMEAVNGGEIFDYVVNREGLKELEAGPLFGQLCDAVHAAHGLGIAHRDLKLENVLLVRKKNAVPSPRGSSPRQARGAAAAATESKIKLIDWGLAHQHTVTNDGAVMPEKLHSRCGSRSYMAPEVTNRDISSTIGYDGFAADVWSLGVCLFAIHLAFFPFEQAHPEHDWRARRVIEAQKAGRSTMATILSFYPQKSVNGGLSKSLLDLLDRMLVFDPAKRASLAEVLCSEWLAPHVPMHHHKVPRALSIAHMATRTSHSISSSSCSDGSLTPRREVDAPLGANARDITLHERIDSGGTVKTTSSLASSTAASIGHAYGVPDGLSRERAANAVAGAIRNTLSPPPPSPTLNVIVAGAAGQRGAMPSTPPVGKTSLEVKEASEVEDFTAKLSKLSCVGSPRHPNRATERSMFV